MTPSALRGLTVICCGAAMLTTACSRQEPPPAQAQQTPLEAGHARRANERAASARERALQYIGRFLAQPDQQALAQQAQPFLKDENILVEWAADHPERVGVFRRFAYERDAAERLAWPRIVFGTLRCGYAGMSISVAMDERTGTYKAIAVYPER